MVFIPTYEDLFGSNAEALNFYRNIFQTTTLNDVEILNLINIAYIKIDPIFGEFRNYTVGEDTKRNHDVKIAVCYESNSIDKANQGGSGTIGTGGINTGAGGSNTDIVSEKIGNITTQYGKNGSGGLGSKGEDLVRLLGLLSNDAGVILARYLRKTYNMGYVAYRTA